MRSLLFLLFLVSLSAFTQTKSKYGAEVINEVETYLEHLQADSSHLLVDLNSIKALQFDIRYATSNNFTGKDSR
jgi:D-alanyl-D-alanine dipeptidase